MLEEKLAQIGFTKNESRLYLELLKMGSQPVSVFAKRLRINRTTTYSLLQSLETRGIIASFHKNGVKYYMANDPNALVGYVDRQCRTFDYYRTELLTMVPDFRKLTIAEELSKPLVKFFDGIEGVKQILSDCMKSKKHCKSFFAIHKNMRSDLREFFQEFRDSRIISHTFNFRCFALDTFDNRAFFTNAHFNENVDIVYLYGEGFKILLDQHINIYDDRVVILHIEPNEEHAIVIESKNFAKAQKATFKLLWESFKK